MANGNGVSRGDRNRNARLGRLRELVPLENAIVGIDLADKKQMVVVTDHDSKVLARKTFRCRAWDLGAALVWAAEKAAAKGFAQVTVACEPTGHRWRVLGQLAEQRGMPFVCVQPMLTSWARRTEDLTFDKTDEKDAVLIARLTAQLRCYVPEPVDETWGDLQRSGTSAGGQLLHQRAHHLVARREHAHWLARQCSAAPVGNVRSPAPSWSGSGPTGAQRENFGHARGTRPVTAERGRCPVMPVRHCS